MATPMKIVGFRPGVQPIYTDTSRNFSVGTLEIVIVNTRGVQEACWVTARTPGAIAVRIVGRG